LAHIAVTLIAASAAQRKEPAKILPFYFLLPLTLISLNVKSNT
jgi:hypothetical protein